MPDKISAKVKCKTRANTVLIFFGESWFAKYHFVGYIDIWSNESGTLPVHSFRGPGAVSQVELSNSGHQLLVVNDNIVRVEQTADGEWKQQNMLELPTKVLQFLVIKIKWQCVTVIL